MSPARDLATYCSERPWADDLLEFEGEIGEIRYVIECARRDQNGTTFAWAFDPHRDVARVHDLTRTMMRIARAEGRLSFDEPSFPADICHEDGLRYPITIRVF